MMMIMPNNDLISREMAIRAMHEEFDECLVWDESGETTANAVENVLHQVQSVDAAPVYHGRWEFCGDDDIVCSACGARYLKKRLMYAYYTGIGSDRMDGFWYCPHCGALLDGKENDPD